MTRWLTTLDDLLRGRRTSGLLDDHASAIPLRAFVFLALVLGVIYGFFMGWYGVTARPEPEYMQLVASMVKLPALFLLTLLVTFPSLYVFAALVGCPLSFGAILRLLIAAIVVNLAVAASLGPILGFFTISTTSYPFMVLLNVVLLGLAGFVGLGFLLNSLRKIAAEGAPPPPSVREQERVAVAPPVGVPGAEEVSGSAVRGLAAELGPGSASARYAQIRTPPPPPRRSEPEMAAFRIFYIWVVIYGLVGAQMGWLLRPFIGNPSMEFTWFRSRYGNFFQGVLSQLEKLLN